MTDFAAARRNMVDGQVLTSDVIDLRLLGAMLDVPREQFVPPAQAGLAYLDLDLPVGEGGSQRRLLKPMVLAKLINAATIGPADHVLDVACGTGYSSALLAQLAGDVVALEDDAALARSAGKNLKSLGNVKVAGGALDAGWPAAAPYDVILVNGAVELEPRALCGQLKDGGRLVCVVGSGRAGKATIYVRSGGEIGARTLFDAAAPALAAFAKTPSFVF